MPSPTSAPAAEPDKDFLTEHATWNVRRLTRAVMVLLVLEFLVRMRAHLFAVLSSRHPAALIRCAAGAFGSIWWGLKGNS